MVAQAPDVFFAEWRDRGPGSRRDIPRAAELLAALGLPDPAAPALGVVGSKGKGTCATYASAALAAAGADVVTVTSPGIRGPRDRIRFNGAAIGGAELSRLAAELETARRKLPPPRNGYLSPSGLFLAAGALYGRERGADLLVLEAGMGGRSDELSLFAPAGVALTGVFGEHLGVLGDTPAQIAAEKAGVAGPGTRFFVHAPLEAASEAAAHAALAARTAGRVRPEVLPEAPEDALPVPSVLPAGLGRPAAALGYAAARRLLEATGRAEPGPDRLREVLSTVRLPARLSHHRLTGGGARDAARGDQADQPDQPDQADRGSGGGAKGGRSAEGPGTELIVDSAVDRVGAAAALDHARRRWGGVDHVVVCLPDHKDVAGAIGVLAGLPVTAASLPDAHLRFSAALPGRWGRVRAEEVTADLLAGLGRRILVLGTVYFTGRVLDAIGADTEALFTR
ncbi:hypothetical protein GCM10027570_53610 [Streptomonospora sediminis]